MVSRSLLLLAVLVTLQGPGRADPEDACDWLSVWIDQSLEGFPDGIPHRVAAERLLRGQSDDGTVVVGGKRPDGGIGVEFAVILADTTTSAGAVRNQWVEWVGQCMRTAHPEWEREETDLEAEIDVPASKAMGRFPVEAYIREDAVATGVTYRHTETGAAVRVITDPTAIASRAAAASYEGPPVVVLIRIEAAQ